MSNLCYIFIKRKKRRAKENDEMREKIQYIKRKKEKLHES